MRVYTATNGLSQIHTYGGGPDNTVNHWDDLSFDAITDFSHGHHARAGGGNDTFNFHNLDEVSGTVVGRLQDFDPSRDEIRIEGTRLDLGNLPPNVRIVAFNGGHNDAHAEPQPWLLIETPAGGHVFYALGGARIDMDGDGGSNGHNHEHHFITEAMVPNFATLQDISYIDDQNLAPAGFRPDGGVVINDTDGNMADVRAQIDGSARGDLIAAGLNDDTVMGEGGNDIIWGGSGNDFVDGGTGNDEIFGNTGADRLTGRGGDDSLDGGIGMDTLEGGAGDDALRGGAGNDVLRGGNSFDSLFGGSGDDRLIGGNGRDVSHGGGGDDLLQDNGQRGWLGGDRLFGGTGEDTILAGGGNDTLRGGGGDDALYGGLDNDVIFGGNNFDKLFGQTGNDRLYGGNGRDLMHGGAGDDILHDNGQTGRFGGDRMIGGLGDDALHIGGGDDTASGGGGDDTFIFFGNHGNDVITDFDSGADDVIDLSAIAAIESMAELRDAASQTGQNVLIDTGNGNSILLENVNRSDLGADDFIFA